MAVVYGWWRWIVIPLLDDLRLVAVAGSWQWLVASGCRLVMACGQWLSADGWWWLVAGG